MDNIDNSSIESKPKNAIRYEWLVSLSFWLVFALEVLPIEADITAMTIPFGRVLVGLAVKLTFMTLIIVPLFTYFVINGQKGLRFVIGRIIAILMIIIVRLIFDVTVYLPYFYKSALS
jgi:hypothetical protein